MPTTSTTTANAPAPIICGKFSLKWRSFNRSHQVSVGKSSRVLRSELGNSVSSTLAIFKIANVLETELPSSERKTREDFPTETWWDRLKDRHFRLNFPQIIGAGALAVVVLVVGIFGIPGSHPKTGELNMTDMQ